ncbi:MAG: hypothetical protein QOF62_322 [Pyrinomonadaceae bacterium]|jgi:transcriptional regulator with XRE-family HTH domain|nr:hypothetical protein [Pyrinomonadaceae bacterium]
MNYEDQLKNLQEQIRREREEENSFSKTRPRSFESPTDLVSFLRNMPVTKVAEVTTISSFLRRFRSDLGLNQDDVATALELAPDILKNIESNDCLPWTIPPRAMTLILSTYRVHMDAVLFLTQNSYEIARVSKQISDLTAEAQRLSAWLANINSELHACGEMALLK